MPSNIIKINCSDELTWIVSDSKMPKVIAIPDKYGEKDNEITSGNPSLPCLQTECQD